MLIYARDLNLLLVGEDEAKALGVRVAFVRGLLLVVASLVTGTAVAFSGMIAFVGLVVPHTLRLALGVIYFLIFWQRLPPHAGDGARDGN